MHTENVSVRMAVPGDLGFVGQRGHLAREVILRKIEQGEIILLCMDHEPVGYLWFDYLWSAIPFIDLIYINDTFRKRGLSRELLAFLENQLRERGDKVLFSSSQLDEPEPQAWHRHMGFEECGMIAGLNEGGIGEVFFRKTL